jgi:uncharacterized protein YlxW (UPF0749 family)
VSSSVRRGAWGYIIPLLTILAGTLFAASASTARGTDLRAGSRTKLAELIIAEQRRQQAAQRDYRRLDAAVDALGRRAGERDSRVDAARAQAAAAAPGAAFGPVTGRGLQVVLTDAPRSARKLPTGPSADDLVVHQQDVQGVVNALWAGGATAMQMMDQRLISTSAVRCVGNTLILQGVVYSPPFRITAIGDPARLRAALAAAPEVRVYKQYVAAYGLGYSVRQLNNVRLPGYAGNVTLPHATPHPLTTPHTTVPEPTGASSDPQPR